MGYNPLTVLTPLKVTYKWVVTWVNNLTSLANRRPQLGPQNHGDSLEVWLGVLRISQFESPSMFPPGLVEHHSCHFRLLLGTIVVLVVCVLQCQLVSLFLVVRG